MNQSNIQENKNNTPTTRADSIANWNEYSQPFQTVSPSRMLALNQTVSEYASGHVVDFGCGAGKIIPFVLSRSNVLSYTGIDASMDMIKGAAWMAEQFPRQKSRLIHSVIEEVELPVVDTAISINSYYAWDKSEIVLQHIYRQLHSSSVFVLATLNKSIDMPALLAEAELELIAHPHWQAFKQHNLSICANDQINAVDLDTLIGQVRRIGFHVEEAHRKYYDNGLNFLVLRVK